MCGDGEDRLSKAEDWDESPEHASAWRAAHRAGWSAYSGWREQGWPARDCIAATVGAAVTAYMTHPKPVGSPGMDGDGEDRPQPPQGVRIRIGSTWINVEPLYWGRTTAGVHEWRVILIAPPELDGGSLIDELRADTLAPDTSLGIEVQRP